MPRPTVAEIDLDAVQFNYRQVERLAGGARICPAVKADGYGHGAVEVARALISAGAGMLAVAITEEAARLRESGIETPILLLGCAPPEDCEEIVRLGVTSMVCTLAAARNLSQAALSLGRGAKVHIKVDTGMGRVGVQEDDAGGLAAAVAALPGLEAEGVFTHLPSADEADEDFTRRQIERFRRLTEELEAAGVRPPLLHAANSAAILRFPEARLDMVRPGIMIYGLCDARPLPEGVELRQAMRLKSGIVFLKELPRGKPVSYGRTFVTSRQTRVATIPIGYADGYNRLLSNRGSALVRGVRVPVIGRVCMDQTLLDVTDLPGVREGDEVVLWGAQGGGFIPIEEVASLAGTISNDVVCAVGKRVPRIYIQGRT